MAKGGGSLSPERPLAAAATHAAAAVQAAVAQAVAAAAAARCATPPPPQPQRKPALKDVLARALPTPVRAGASRYVPAHGSLLANVPGRAPGGLPPRQQSPSQAVTAQPGPRPVTTTPLPPSLPLPSPPPAQPPFLADGSQESQESGNGVELPTACQAPPPARSPSPTVSGVRQRVQPTAAFGSGSGSSPRSSRSSGNSSSGSSSSSSSSGGAFVPYRAVGRPPPGALGLKLDLSAIGQASGPPGFSACRWAQGFPVDASARPATPRGRSPPATGPTIPAFCAGGGTMSLAQHAHAAFEAPPASARSQAPPPPESRPGSARRRIPQRFYDVHEITPDVAQKFASAALPEDAKGSPEAEADACKDGTRSPQSPPILLVLDESGWGLNSSILSCSNVSSSSDEDQIKARLQVDCLESEQQQLPTMIPEGDHNGSRSPADVSLGEFEEPCMTFRLHGDEQVPLPVGMSC